MKEKKDKKKCDRFNGGSEVEAEVTVLMSFELPGRLIRKK